MAGIKLSPAIKHLLTLRQPNALPSPPTLHSILFRTFQDARQKKAEAGWLVLTTCTLLTTNRPSSVGHLYRFVTRSDPSNVDSSRVGVAEAVNKAALIREAALKSVIFVGVPRPLLSMGALAEALEDDVRASLRKDSRRIATPENIEQTVARGHALWDSIYEPHERKLYNKIGSYHPDFISFIIQCYGAVLSPLPGGKEEQGNLTRAQGSIVGTACLRAEGGVGPQLTSHVFGLLKARAVKDQSDEDQWLSSDEGTEWVIRTVDSILDAVAVGPERGPEAKVKL